MMNDTKSIAGKGLYFLFIGEIASLLFFIPLIGTVAGAAGALISLYGFYILSRVSGEYHTAFVLTVVNIVLRIISGFTPDGIFQSGLLIICELLGLGVVYFVCNATAQFLTGTEPKLTARSQLIWKLYAMCTVVSVFCSLLSVIPVLNILSFAVSAVISAVQLIAGILYLTFLWSSQNALRKNSY